MQLLLDEALKERRYHRSRKKLGQIESLASNIRIRAILDCLIVSGQITATQANYIFKKG